MSNQKAILTTVTDPFHAFKSRDITHVEIGQTVLDVLFANDYVRHVDGEIKRVGYFFVTINAKEVMQADWNTVLGDEDHMVVWNIPLGGKGGGSNVGMIIMTVVMVAAAAFTGGATLAVALAWGAAAGAAVALLSTMMPVPEAANSSLGREATSPTYSISAQGNSARLLESIPVQYGRMRVYPDFAAQPYTENRGNQTFLYQLFCLGQGTYNIEAIQIEDANISSFGEVEYEIIQPGQPVTLFPDNVISSEAVQGLEMLGPNESGFTVLGPFVVSPAGVKTNYISVDVSMPQGAYTLYDDGYMGGSFVNFLFEYREISDAGVPIGAWQTLIQTTLSYQTQSSQMETFKIPVEEGRYQVRGQRTTYAPTDSRTGNKIAWTNLKGFVPSTNDYGNVTMLAVIVKATNNLNSSTSRRFNVIQTRLIPKWNPIEGWSLPVATSNPAWAFADALRNADYSIGWSINRLNLPELYRLSQVWDSRGDEFNGVFDKTITLWSAITQILAVGRTTPIYYAGVIDAIRDEPKTIPAQIFTNANILENTFKSSYKLGTKQTPDHVIIEYFDEETWSASEVTCILPGSAAINPARKTIFGITKRDQAWREGMYTAAVNRDQRGRYNFSTEMEGLLLRFGDMIKVSHDVPAWGASGLIEEFDPSTGRIYTSEPMDFALPVQYYIAIRKPNGKQDGPYKVKVDLTPMEGANSAIIDATAAQLAAIHVSDGIRTDLTQYVFGPADLQAANLIVLGAKPNNRGEVALELCDYTNSVHIADQGGDVPIPPPNSNLPGTIVGPIVASVTVVDTVVVGQQQIVATPAVGSIYYEYQAKPTTGGNWIALGQSADPTFGINFEAGPWTVRVRGVGSIPGPWATWIGEIRATTLPLAFLDTFHATGQLFAIRLDWSFAAQTNTIAKSVQIFYGASAILGNSQLLVELPYPANAFIHSGLGAGERGYYWARVIDTAARVGPWYNNSAPISTTAESSPDIILDALEGAITNTQLSQDLQEEISQGGGAATEIAQIKDELSASITLRAQVRTADGQLAIAGVAIGVEPVDGELISQVLVLADRFAILDPALNMEGTPQIPFAVQDGAVYIRNAFIQNGSITNAKIGNVIQSDALGTNGQPVWKLDKQGTFALNSPSTGGRMEQTADAIKIFDEAGTKRIQLGNLLL